MANLSPVAIALVQVMLWVCTCPHLQVQVSADNNKHAYRADANSDEDGQTVLNECSDDSDGETCHGVDPERTGDLGTNMENGATASGNGSFSETEASKFNWDPKGYVLFCPCMGRLGNQGEHYLGAMAFAKALDRTLVLPPFRTFKHASFGELFELVPIREFHRTILMEDFMAHLAPKYWPPGKRTGYSHLPRKSEIACEMKNGNPFGPFWSHFNIDFDDCVKHQLLNFADVTKEDSMKKTKQQWHSRFPPKEHPVLALRGSPGSFPMLAGNRDLQKYLRWAPAFFADAGKYIQDTFRGEGFVGIHLRNGKDWKKACEHAEGVPRFMASPQCLENTPNVMVSRDICFPKLSKIRKLTSQVFNKVNAKHLFIATDSEPYVEDFEELLNPIGISVHYLKPELAETDLMILAQSDFFIGNCISSFTSFVKRERDVNGRPSTFWGLNV